MIVAIANRKGGVGKTFVASLLINVFSTNGHKVLAIDLDSQANLSKLLLGFERYEEVKACNKTLDKLYVALRADGDAEPDSFVTHYRSDVKVAGKLPNVEVSLIAAHEDMDLQSRGFASTGGLGTELSERLQAAITTLSRHYNYVFLDCPPGLTDAFIAAIRIANHIVIPYETDDEGRANDGINRAVAETYGIEEGEHSKADQIFSLSMAERSRRYHTLANKIQNNRERQVVVANEIGRRHPQLKTRIAFKPDLKESVVWSKFPRLFKQRYGSEGKKVADSLYRELLEIEKVVRGEE